MSKYYFKYMLKGIPYYYEFTCYAESEKYAEALFLMNASVYDLEEYHLASVEPVCKRYEVYRCPQSPQETGEYIGSTPIREQAEEACCRYNAEQALRGSPDRWFVKGVTPAGEKVTFL